MLFRSLVASAQCWLFLVAASVMAATPAEVPQRELANSIGLKLVLIPAGEFRMGAVEPAEAVVRRFPGYDMRPEDFRA